MLAKVYSAGLIGLRAQPIEVEVDLPTGLYSFHIVGLPDKAVNESKERISSAVKNSGFKPPEHSRRRLIVNLAPAHLKKEGPAYDLPMAIAFLLASNQVNFENLEDKLFLGELSLEGKVRPINGLLAIALMAKQERFQTLFVPQDNAAEAALVKELEIIPVESLSQLIAHLKGEELIARRLYSRIEHSAPADELVDLAYIKGQEQAKRALEIAAAGGHNLLMHGPPGAGKTLLARSFPSILPPLTFNETLEVTNIFSVAGCLPNDRPLLTNRPFRAPHHTASAISLIGGGSYPRPGEVTLAHRGVLFLDEFPEFPRQVLDSLRQPLEDNLITVSRASGSLTFPAKFILIGAMNPCPCGKLGDPGQICTCSPAQISRYRGRISGPLLDRIDLHIEVPRLTYEKLASHQISQSSKLIKERVIKARYRQKKRFSGEKGIMTNSDLDIRRLRKYCRIDLAGRSLLRQAMSQLHLSARSYHRLLKLARTIADLEKVENIQASHIAEAIQYRPKQDDF